MAFNNALKTPGSFGGKKSLLKKMVRNIMPTRLSVKKASLKSVLGKNISPKTPAAGLKVTGGSPFKLNAGLGPNVPSDAIMSSDTIQGGNGSNLGTKGVF